MKAVANLERHHTLPRYQRSGALKAIPKPMSWRGWDGYYYQSGKKGDSKGYRDRERKTKAQQKQSSANIIGYDGTKIALSEFSASSSASAYRSQEEWKPDGVSEIKAVLREIIPPEKATNPALQKFLAEDPADMIKQQQKELNRRRKRQKRIETLKKQEQSKQEAYQQWKASIKSMMKAEEVRHQEAMEKIRDELQKAMQESEEEAEDKVNDMSTSEAEEEQVPAVWRQMLAESEERCRVLALNNVEMGQKMQDIIDAFARQQQQQKPECPASPTGTTPDVLEVPDKKEAKSTSLDTMSPPAVVSPGTAAVKSSYKERDPMKPFRTEKLPRETPYTPKIRPDKKEAEASEEQVEKIE